jgi:hypothetical protein
VWVYVAVFAAVIVFLVGSYLTLGRNSEVTDQQLFATVQAGGIQLKKMTDELQAGQSDTDLEAVRKHSSGWQARLEPARDVESLQPAAGRLITGFSLLEWAARLKLQGEKSETGAFAEAASSLLDEANAVVAQVGQPASM